MVVILQSTEDTESSFHYLAIFALTKDEPWKGLFTFVTSAGREKLSRLSIFCLTAGNGKRKEES